MALRHARVLQKRNSCVQYSCVCDASFDCATPVMPSLSSGSAARAWLLRVLGEWPNLGNCISPPAKAQVSVSAAQADTDTSLKRSQTMAAVPTKSAAMPTGKAFVRCLGR